MTVARYGKQGEAWVSLYCLELVHMEQWLHRIADHIKLIPKRYDGPWGRALQHAATLFRKNKPYTYCIHVINKKLTSSPLMSSDPPSANISHCMRSKSICLSTPWEMAFMFSSSSMDFRALLRCVQADMHRCLASCKFQRRIFVQIPVLFYLSSLSNRTPDVNSIRLGQYHVGPVRKSPIVTIACTKTRLRR